MLTDGADGGILRPMTGTSGMSGMSSGSFDELVAAWIYTHGSANTQAAYRRDLRAFETWCVAGDQDPLAVTADDLERFQSDCLGDGAAASSVKRRVSAVSSFFQWSVGTGAVATNPLDGIVRTRAEPAVDHRPRALSPTDVERLHDALAHDDPKAAVLVAMLVREGLRLSEILALDVGDLGTRPAIHQLVATPRSADAPPSPASPVSPKSTARIMSARLRRHGRDRWLALDAQTGRAIRRYLGDRAHGPLLLGDSPTTERGVRLTRFGADFVLKRVGRAAGLTTPLTAGVLRGTYVANAREAGANVEDLRHQLGHRDARSTRRYLAEGDDAP